MAKKPAKPVRKSPAKPKSRKPAAKKPAGAKARPAPKKVKPKAAARPAARKKAGPASGLRLHFLRRRPRLHAGRFLWRVEFPRLGFCGQLADGLRGLLGHGHPNGIGYERAPEGRASPMPDGGDGENLKLYHLLTEPGRPFVSELRRIARGACLAGLERPDAAGHKTARSALLGDTAFSRSLPRQHSILPRTGRLRLTTSSWRRRSDSSAVGGAPD